MHVLYLWSTRGGGRGFCPSQGVVDPACVERFREDFTCTNLEAGK